MSDSRRVRISLFRSDGSEVDVKERVFDRLTYVGEQSPEEWLGTTDVAKVRAIIPGFPALRSTLDSVEWRTVQVSATNVTQLAFVPDVTKMMFISGTGVLKTFNDLVGTTSDAKPQSAVLHGDGGVITSRADDAYEVSLFLLSTEVDDEKTVTE